MSKIIKYERIILDKKTAYLKPLIWDKSIECGDKNGDYSISINMLEKKYIALAWDDLYRLIYEGGENE